MALRPLHHPSIGLVTHDRKWLMKGRAIIFSESYRNAPWPRDRRGTEPLPFLLPIRLTQQLVEIGKGVVGGHRSLAGR